MATTQPEGGWWGCLHGSLLSGKPDGADKAAVGEAAASGRAAPEDATSTRGASSTSQSTTSWTSSKAPLNEAEPSVGLGGLSPVVGSPEVAAAERAAVVSAESLSPPLPPQPPVVAAAASATEVLLPGVDGASATSPPAAGTTVLPPPVTPPYSHERRVAWSPDGSVLGLSPGAAPAAAVATSLPQVAPAVAAAPPSTPVVPPLHCSEFLQAIIGKQHEIERFMQVPADDIPASTMTKMAMVKGELDLLSASITGVLGRSPHRTEAGQRLPPGATAPAPPLGAPPCGAGWTVRASEQARFAEQELAAAQPPAQIWPPMPAAHHAPAAYPGEMAYPYPAEGAYNPEGGTLGDWPYQVGLAEPHPPGTKQGAAYEDHGGPAIFQGFQPPPSYAWNRGQQAEAEAAAAEASKQPASPEQPPEAAAAAAPTVPRPKSINTSSPPRERPTEPGVKLVLAAAMDELRRCQSSCAQLRAEKRGVPTQEVERWCASVANQLKLLAERLEEKLEAHRRRSRAKDETIRRLYRRLQAAEQAASERGSAGGMSHSPSLVGRRGFSADEVSGGSVAAAAAATVAGMLAAGRASGAALEAVPLELHSEGSSGGWFAGGGFREPGGGLGAHGGEAGAEHSAAQVAAAAFCEMGAPSPQASPSSAGTRVSSSAHQMAEDTARPPASARVGRRGMVDPASQKSLSRPVDRSQQVHLRREVAHLRRRDVDLAGQLRARDQQIEQLTHTMRELQLVTQRQIGLYKRQLHLKDNELQAKQEELNQQVTAHAPSAAPLGGAADSGRGGRRHGAQAPSSSAPGFASPQGAGPGLTADRRGHRGGVTPRPADCDRGRVQHHVGATSSWASVGPTKKEVRERSLGAPPHSPRAKARAGGDTGVQGLVEGTLRRRTSPTVSLGGRSTSADERAAARRRQEAEAAAAAAMQAVKGQALRLRDGGPPATARQRR